MKKRSVLFFLTYHELIVLKIFYLLLLLFPKFCLQIVIYFLMDLLLQITLLSKLVMSFADLYGTPGRAHYVRESHITPGKVARQLS